MQTIDLTGLNIDSSNTSRYLDIEAPAGAISAVIEVGLNTLTKAPSGGILTLTHANFTSLGITWGSEIYVTFTLSTEETRNYQFKITGQPTLNIQSFLGATDKSVYIDVDVDGKASTTDYCDRLNEIALNYLISEEEVDRLIINFPSDFEGSTVTLTNDVISAEAIVSGGQLQLRMAKETSSPSIEGYSKEVTDDGNINFQSFFENGTGSLRIVSENCIWEINIGGLSQIDPTLEVDGINIYEERCRIMTDNNYMNSVVVGGAVMGTPLTYYHFKGSELESAINLSQDNSLGYRLLENIDTTTSTLSEVVAVDKVYYRGFSSSAETVIRQEKKSRPSLLSYDFSIFSFPVLGEGETLLDFEELGYKGKLIREEWGEDLALRGEDVEVKWRNKISSLGSTNEYAGTDKLDKISLNLSLNTDDICYRLFYKTSGAGWTFFASVNHDMTVADVIDCPDASATHWLLVPIGGGISGLWVNEKLTLGVTGTVSSNGTSTAVYHEPIRDRDSLSLALEEEVQYLLNQSFGVVLEEGVDITLTTSGESNGTVTLTYDTEDIVGDGEQTITFTWNYPA